MIKRGLDVQWIWWRLRFGALWIAALPRLELTLFWRAIELAAVSAGLAPARAALRSGLVLLARRIICRRFWRPGMSRSVVFFWRWVRGHRGILTRNRYWCLWRASLGDM